MSSPVDRRIEVAVATPNERRVALGLVLASAPSEAHAAILEAAERSSGPLGPFDALVVARAGGRVVAAAWAQPQAGSVASLWPPAGPGCTDSTAEDLLRAVNTQLDGSVGRSAVAMTQALFEVESDPRIALVGRGGYRRVAELLYLGRTAQPDSRWAATASANVSFEAYAGAEGRLHRLIEESYVGSLDCPAIDGVRPVEETLAGYRATGRFDPESWRIAVVEGRDAGVVIVAPHDDSDQAELVYMGLAPWARGRGLGRCLVDEAMRRAAVLGADLLITAVDAANTPARRVYEAAGFATWSRRFVFIRTPRLDLAAATESAPCDP